MMTDSDKINSKKSYEENKAVLQKPNFKDLATQEYYNDRLHFVDTRICGRSEGKKRGVKGFSKS